MRFLSRAVKTVATGGASIPTVFPTWETRQIAIRRAEVSMIAGPPGAGKSTLALRLAVGAGVGTLYFSADTHSHTMAMRAAAMLTGEIQSAVEQRIEDDPRWASQTLSAIDHIKWCFDSAPSLKDIEEEIHLYQDMNGTNPELIIIDNAVDVTHQDGDEFSSLRSLMRELKWWARDTEAAVLILHHTSEAVQGNPCPPRSAIHGKVNQTPAVILTVSSPTTGLMAVCPVKNRYGPADATGSTPTWLNYDAASMYLADSGAR